MSLQAILPFPMSSILSIVRSLFRDGTLPMPGFYGFNVKKLTSEQRGSSVEVVSADFPASDFVFELINDSNVYEGDTFTINNLFVEMDFEYSDGRWKVKRHWIRPSYKNPHNK